MAQLWRPLTSSSQSGVMMRPAYFFRRTARSLTAIRRHQISVAIVVLLTCEPQLISGILSSSVNSHNTVSRAISQSAPYAAQRDNTNESTNSSFAASSLVEGAKPQPVLAHLDIAEGSLMSASKGVHRSADLHAHIDVNANVPAGLSSYVEVAGAGQSAVTVGRKPGENAATNSIRVEFARTAPEQRAGGKESVPTPAIIQVDERAKGVHGQEQRVREQPEELRMPHDSATMARGPSEGSQSRGSQATSLESTAQDAGRVSASGNSTGDTVSFIEPVLDHTSPHSKKQKSIAIAISHHGQSGGSLTEEYLSKGISNLERMQTALRDEEGEVGKELDGVVQQRAAQAFQNQGRDRVVPAFESHFEAQSTQDHGTRIRGELSEHPRRHRRRRRRRRQQSESSQTAESNSETSGASAGAPRNATGSQEGVFENQGSPGQDAESSEEKGKSSSKDASLEEKGILSLEERLGHAVPVFPDHHHSASSEINATPEHQRVSQQAAAQPSADDRNTAGILLEVNGSQPANLNADHLSLNLMQTSQLPTTTRKVNVRNHRTLPQRANTGARRRTRREPGPPRPRGAQQRATPRLRTSHPTPPASRPGDPSQRFRDNRSSFPTEGTRQSGSVVRTNVHQSPVRYHVQKAPQTKHSPQRTAVPRSGPLTRPNDGQGRSEQSKSQPQKSRTGRNPGRIATSGGTARGLNAPRPVAHSPASPPRARGRPREAAHQPRVPARSTSGTRAERRPSMRPSQADRASRMPRSNMPPLPRERPRGTVHQPVVPAKSTSRTGAERRPSVRPPQADRGSRVPRSNMPLRTSGGPTSANIPNPAIPRWGYVVGRSAEVQTKSSDVDSSAEEDDGESQSEDDSLWDADDDEDRDYNEGDSGHHSDSGGDNGQRGLYVPRKRDPPKEEETDEDDLQAGTQEDEGNDVPTKRDASATNDEETDEEDRNAGTQQDEGDDVPSKGRHKKDEEADEEAGTQQDEGNDEDAPQADTQPDEGSDHRQVHSSPDEWTGTDAQQNGTGRDKENDEDDDEEATWPEEENGEDDEQDAALSDKDMDEEQGQAENEGHDEQDVPLSDEDMDEEQGQAENEEHDEQAAAWSDEETDEDQGYAARRSPEDDGGGRPSHEWSALELAAQRPGGHLNLAGGSTHTHSGSHRRSHYQTGSDEGSPGPPPDSEDDVGEYPDVDTVDYAWGDSGDGQTGTQDFEEGEFSPQENGEYEGEWDAGGYDQTGNQPADFHGHHHYVESQDYEDDWIKEASTSAGANDGNWGPRKQLHIYSQEDIYKQAHTTIAGLDYLGSGYDLLKGNPFGDPETSVDPGFRAPVLRFYWTHDPYGVTNGLNLLQPVGGFVRPLVSCRRSETAEEISSMSDYQRELSVDAKVEVGAPFVSFSAGTSYKDMARDISNKEEKTYFLRTYCFRYEAGLATAPQIKWTPRLADEVQELPVVAHMQTSVYSKCSAPPDDTCEVPDFSASCSDHVFPALRAVLPRNTTYGFEQALQNLSTDFNGLAEGTGCPPSVYKATPLSDTCRNTGVTSWMNLFEQYGTHVTNNVKLGGKIVHSIRLSKESVDTMKDQGVAVSAALSVNAFAYSGGASTSTATSSSKQDANAHADRRVTTYIIGGRPPKDISDPSMLVLWSKTVEELPMPIQTKLQPLSVYMPAEFQAAYDNALVYYGRAFGLSQAELDRIFHSEASTVADRLRTGHSVVWAGAAPGFIECPAEEFVILGFAIAVNFSALEANSSSYHLAYCPAGRRRCEGPISPGVPGDEARIWVVCGPTELVALRNVVAESLDNEEDGPLEVECPAGMQVLVGVKFAIGYGPGGAAKTWVEHCDSGKEKCSMSPRPPEHRIQVRRFIYAACLESTYPGLQSLHAISSVGDVGEANNKAHDSDGTVVLNCGPGRSLLFGWTLEAHTRAEDVRDKFRNCTSGQQMCIMKAVIPQGIPLQYKRRCEVIKVVPWHSSERKRGRNDGCLGVTADGRLLTTLGQMAVQGRSSPLTGDYVGKISAASAYPVELLSGPRTTHQCEFKERH